MASFRRSKNRDFRAAPSNVVEDDVIIEEVLPEEETCSQMNILSGRDEVSSAKLQEIYDRKFGRPTTRPPSRPNSSPSLRSTKTVDLSSATRKSADEKTRYVRFENGSNIADNDQVDDNEVENIVKQLKASKVYEYDTELGIRTIEAESDTSDDSDEDNTNENKPKKKKKPKQPEIENEDDDEENPFLGRRGKCPLQLLSEFIDALTLKDFELALKLCQMILIFEPTNEIALEFIPNLEEKIQYEALESSDSDSDSSSGSESDDGDDDSGSESDEG